MSTFALVSEAISTTIEAVASEAREGLSATPKTLAPWLFYDEAGSRLFEQITTLPEYYLTRTERDLFTTHADEIFATLDANLTIVELGAGTAIPTVRHFSEAIAQRHRGSLIRINLREAHGPRDTICLSMGALAGLQAIDAARLSL